MASNSSETKSNSVYIVSLVITIAVVAWGLVSPDSFGAFAKALNGGLTKYYGWGYLLTMNIFVAFCLFIGCSRFGKMRLGPEDSRPEYSNLSWVAMLFSAGMGVGLVFYGAAEPLFYFGSTPLGAEPGSIQAALFKSSMTYELLLIVVIGGIGSISGSCIASFLYIALSEWWLRGLDMGRFLGIDAPDLFRSGFRRLVFSVIIMVIVLFFSRGIMGDKELSFERFKDGMKGMKARLARTKEVKG